MKTLSDNLEIVETCRALRYENSQENEHDIPEIDEAGEEDIELSGGS